MGVFEIGGRADLFDQVQPPAQADHLEGGGAPLRTRVPRGLDGLLQPRGRGCGFDRQAERQACIRESRTVATPVKRFSTVCAADSNGPCSPSFTLMT